MQEAKMTIRIITQTHETMISGSKTVKFKLKLWFGHLEVHNKHFIPGALSLF